MQSSERDGSEAGGACDGNRRIERNQTLGKVAGISRDAVATATKDCMLSIDTVHCGATRSGVALVACGPGRIAKIRTPGPLKHIAAKRRHVAKLCAGGELQALRNDGIGFDDLRMVGGGRHLDHGPKTYAIG